MSIDANGFEKVDWSVFKDFVDSRNTHIQYIEDSKNYWLKTQDYWFSLSTNITKVNTSDSSLIDFENNYKANSNKVLGSPNKALASNIDETGKKLFSRFTGLPRQLINSGQSHVFNFTIPYTECKFDLVEVINSDVNDVANLKILDDNLGTISGIPNAPINQFGFTVNLHDKVSCFEGKYPSTLFAGLIISVEYTNNSLSDKEVSVNFRLHELK